jgi:iron complex outermembrane receptor protein
MIVRSFRLAVCAAVLSLASSAVPCLSAAAEPVPSFTVEAQPLGAALLKLGQMAGRNILFDPEQVKGLTSQRVSGLPFEEALKQLLSGTGLRFAIGANGQVTVARDHGRASLDSRAVDIGSVGVSDSAGGGDTPFTNDDTRPAKKGTVAAIAPFQGSLNEIQPKTVMKESYLRDVISPFSDYLSIIQNSPSASDSTPNGIGTGSKNGTLRGFQDGEYNVTFDGIPYASPVNFGHQTNSFFPAPVLGTIAVDRGPGLASNVGNATFGGTVSLYSRDLKPEFGAQGLGVFGSANSYQASALLDTGVLKDVGGMMGSFNVSRSYTDGLLQYAHFMQDNYAVKSQLPVGDNIVFTGFAELNHKFLYNYSQQTAAMAAMFGHDYGELNNDPTSQSYYGYNWDKANTDFEYIRMQADFGRIRVDNRLYTYSFDDDTKGSLDTSGNTPNSRYLASGVPGTYRHQFFRETGDVLKVEADLVEAGLLASTARVGLWYDHGSSSVKTQDINLVTGAPSTFIPYQKVAGDSITTTGWDSPSDSVEPYFEIEWRPTSELSVIPGVKYVDYSRSLAGRTGLSGSGPTLENDSESNTTVLGSVAANYKILPTLAAYAQWGQGFQASPESTLAVSAPQLTSLNPEKSNNYQTGAVWQDDHLTADADVYFIAFNNKIAQIAVPLGTYYSNLGGVYYKGLEGQATYLFGDTGLAVNFNGSINFAQQAGTHLTIAEAPKQTAGGGILYDKDGFYGSLMLKYVGPRFATLYSATNPNTNLPAYYYSNLTVGYRYRTNVRISLTVNNLTDRLTATDGSGAAVNPTYYYMPARNFMGQILIRY